MAEGPGGKEEGRRIERRGERETQVWLLSSPSQVGPDEASFRSFSVFWKSVPLLQFCCTFTLSSPSTYALRRGQTANREVVY